MSKKYCPPTNTYMRGTKQERCDDKDGNKVHYGWESIDHFKGE